MHYWLLPLLLILGFPATTLGSVRINEVAWMGTLTSANDEWIELYAGGETTDITGWTLVSGDGALLIPLSGSIAGGGFFLLERTDDQSVPGVSADGIYTGSLSNGGEVLILKNANGTTVDTVDGSDGWSIGGNNDSKETLQRSASGWGTAPGTPRRDNGVVVTSGTSAPKSSSGASESSSSAGVKSAAKQESSIDPPFTVFGGGDRIVIVGADSEFVASAKGREGKPLTNATYVWSFGDGETGEGARVFHRYRTPGEYVAVVTVGNIDLRASVGDRVGVTAVQADLALSLGGESLLHIKNNSDVEIDLSRWIVTSGAGQQFSLPSPTFLQARGTLALHPETLGFIPTSESALWYPNAIRAATIPQTVTVSERTSAPQLAVIGGESKDVPTAHPPTRIPSSENSEEVASPNVPEVETAALPLRSEPESSPMLLWGIGLIAILGIGSAAVLLTRKERDAEGVSEDRTFEIIDATPIDEEYKN